ncbi:MAG TPA: LLM class F420-dependent oxidoreductase [Thermomicrobiales bacterium]|jgi:F420-dependent oxidoreductase-like protein
MAVQFGVVLPQGFKWDLGSLVNPVARYEAMTRVAVEAERLGYASVWLYDHLHAEQRPSSALPGESETLFESWTSTAALARDTSTIRLGQMVSCNLYRNPALLAKMASTVDVLSHGRLDFGLGAGWYEGEASAYGYPFPGAAERLERLEESLQIILAVWTESAATFEGRYARVRGAINEPKGVQQPHIPLWVGGAGERKTLELVARCADACNVIAHDATTVRRKFDALREHCARVGREYGAIRKSVHAFVVLLQPGEDLDAATKSRGALGLDVIRRSNIVGTPVEVAERLHELVVAGTDYFILYFRNRLVQLDTVRLFAHEVMPLFGGHRPSS